MDPTASEQHKPVSAWRSPWVIAWVGLVVVVLGVNLTMVYLAIETNPGLVVEDYYDRGQHYERTMISAMAKDPGWEMRADIPAEILAGAPTAIRFFLVDRAGQPVVADGVDFFAYRPSDASQDFSLAMTDEGKGRYLAEVTFPLIGIWDTLIAIKSGEQEYNLGKRVSVQRP
jgi:nitrogen fixation protein FixH